MTTGDRLDRDHDVVVVGDGPGGAALASACATVGLDVCVVGSGLAWSNTYGVWLDELEFLPRSVFATVSDHVIVGSSRLRRLTRAYGVIDNTALRRHLELERFLRIGTMRAIEPDSRGATVVLADGRTITASIVVDASGHVATEPRAWQSAYGLVVPESVASDVATIDAATLMDWSWSLESPATIPSFLYVVPVADGWLVEHTVLAATPAVEPATLRRGLVERLGSSVVDAAERDGRVEAVMIPMGVPIPLDTPDGVVAFGVAGGMIHPATGYSVGAALRAAPGAARAIARGDDPGAALWPRAARTTRRLHDVGLEALLRLDRDGTIEFFERFFGLPTEAWSSYLRIDATPMETARVMGSLFRCAPWSVRRQLLAGGVDGLCRAGVRRGRTLGG